MARPAGRCTLTNDSQDRALTKVDIVDALRRRYGYTRYLEITTTTTGLRYPEAKALGFEVCMRLVYDFPGTIDDGLPVDFSAYSTDISACLREIRSRGLVFDVILVDAHHTYDCAYRDIIEAYSLIRIGGGLVVHDCNPLTSEIASPEFLGGDWCGVSYKAFLDFALGNPRFDYFTIDTDFGCGVILRSTSAVRLAKNLLRALGQRTLKRRWAALGMNFDAAFELFDTQRAPLLRLGGPSLLDVKLSMPCSARN